MWKGLGCGTKWIRAETWEPGYLGLNSSSAASHVGAFDLCLSFFVFERVISSCLRRWIVRPKCLEQSVHACLPTRDGDSWRKREKG